MFESWFNLLASFTKINIPSLLFLVFAGLIFIVYRNKRTKKDSINTIKTHKQASTPKPTNNLTNDEPVNSGESENNTMREIKAAGIPQVNRKNRKQETEEIKEDFTSTPTVSELVSEKISEAKQEESQANFHYEEKFFAEVRPLNQNTQTNYSPYYHVDFQNIIERKQVIRDFVDNILEEKYIYLYGEKSQGKTYLLDIVSHQLAYMHEFYTVHYSCSEKNNSLQSILFNILNNNFIVSVEENLTQKVLFDILQNQVTKQNTLLIIDNAEHLCIKEINQLLALENCHLVFISNLQDKPQDIEIYSEEIEYLNISDISRHIIHNISQTISPDNLSYVIDFVDNNIYLFNLLCRASINFSQKNIINTLEEIEKIEASNNTNKLLTYIFNNLSKDSQELLIYISLLGTDVFSLETLASVINTDNNLNVNNSLNELLNLSIINRASQENYYACHELIREFALANSEYKLIQKNFTRNLQAKVINEIKQQEHASPKSNIIQSIANNIELCLNGEVNIYFMHFALDFIRNYSLESLAVQATDYLHSNKQNNQDIQKLYSYALSISSHSEKEIQHVFKELNSLITEDNNLDKLQTLQYLAFAYYKNYEIKQDILSLELAIQTQEKILENQKELSTSYTVKLLIELAHYYSIKATLVPEDEREYSNYISLEIYRKIINVLNQSTDKIDYKLQEKLYCQMGDIVAKLNNYEYPCDEKLNNRELAISYYQQGLKYNSPAKEELYQKVAHLYWELSLTKDIDKKQKQKYLQLNIASLKHLLDILIISKSSIETDVLEIITDIIAIRNNISVSYKELSQLSGKYINLELSFNYLKQALDMASEYHLDNYINIVQNQMFELYQLIRADKILASTTVETDSQEQDLEDLKAHIVKELANSFTGPQ